MLADLRKRFESIDRLDLWLAVRRATRRQHELNATYRKKEQELSKQNAFRELKRIEDQLAGDSEVIWAPIWARRTDMLVAKARKYGVPIPKMPETREDFDKNDDWYLSVGELLLSGAATERLKRNIKIEQRQEYDEFRKTAGVLLAAAAFVLGLVSLLVKTKQPDPCPKNYYRSDSGECVFALSASQQPAHPVNVPTPKKPSAVHP